MDTILDHGQPLLALTPADWQDVLQSGHLLGRPISAIFRQHATTALTYAAQYPELGVYIGDMDGRFFLLQVLVDMHGYAQRVFLERLTCRVCPWSGMSAEPFTSDNYLLLLAATRLRLLRQAAALLPAPCPRCGAQLPRRSVWTEDA